MRALVYGTGAVGARVARQLASAPAIDDLILVEDDQPVVSEVLAAIGPPARPATINALRQESRRERFAELCESVDVAVLTADDDHYELAQTALQSGTHVVSVADDLETVRQLLGLQDFAQKQQRNLVIGAGFAPGLSCLLARHGASALDVVDEIYVAKFGTGGPACARQHHRALRSDALDWRNQQWERRRGGSGRELCWFPDPVGGLDCYQAAVPDALLFLEAFPGVVRASARVAATRRDRSTTRLPMLRNPHPEGSIGAIRVELRGWKSSARTTIVLGVLDRPAVGAAIVAATAAQWAHAERFNRLGAGGLAQLVSESETVSFLQELAKWGVKAAVFEGSTAAGS